MGSCTVEISWRVNGKILNDFRHIKRTIDKTKTVNTLKIINIKEYKDTENNIFQFNNKIFY